MGNGPQSLEDLPKNSCIRIREANDARKVVEILPGGERSQVFLQFFIVGAIIASGATLLLGAGAVQEGFPAVVLLGPALLWCLVVALALIWLRVRFSRFLLSLESDRMTLQRTVFNRKNDPHHSTRRRDRRRAA